MNANRDRFRSERNRSTDEEKGIESCDASEICVTIDKLANRNYEKFSVCSDWSQKSYCNDMCVHAACYFFRGILPTRVVGLVARTVF